MISIRLFKRFERFGIHVLIGKLESYNFYFNFWVFSNKSKFSRGEKKKKKIEKYYRKIFEKGGYYIKGEDVGKIDALWRAYKRLVGIE